MQITITQVSHLITLLIQNFSGGPVWDDFGKILEPLASSTPYNPTVGNHESIDSFIAYKLRYATEHLQKHSHGGSRLLCPSNHFRRFILQFRLR